MLFGLLRDSQEAGQGTANPHSQSRKYNRASYEIAIWQNNLVLIISVMISGDRRTGNNDYN